MNKLRRFLLLTILFILFVIISAFSYVNAITEGLANNILRIHVIANSNSNEDQELKYIVRDEIIEYIAEISNQYNRNRRSYIICRKQYRGNSKNCTRGNKEQWIYLFN